MVKIEDIPDLNKLTPQIFLNDVKDWMIFTNRSEDVLLVENIHDLKGIADEMLLKHKKFIHTTGGWEGTWAHFQTLHQAVGMPVLLGLEPDSYIRRKGREPFKTLEERIEMWKHIIYPGSRIFVVPENLDGDGYNQLTQDIGIYQRKGVYYLGNRDDTQEIRDARLGRCFSPDHYIEISYGNLHTSNYLE